MGKFSLLASHQSGFDWLSFSPDINPYDCFLCGMLKDQVHRQQFETIADSKAATQKK